MTPPIPIDPILLRNRLFKPATSASPTYTCPSMIREEAQKKAREKAATLETQPEVTPHVIENWCRYLEEKAREKGVLMTDRQFQDWTMGRPLLTGDRCRFIGDDREEVTVDNGVSTRPKGQVGVIASIDDEVITFYPHEPVLVTMPNGTVEKKIVNFVLRVGTKEWLTLERIDND